MIIKDSRIIKLTDEFKEFALSCQRLHPAYVRHISMKLAHTQRVCEELHGLALDLNFEPDVSLEPGGNDFFLAYISALFHDIGRFEQITRFGTFLDVVSADHAKLSIDTIKREGFIDFLPEMEVALILKIILFHNKPHLPGNLTRREFILAALLRDSDKLDIWQTVLNEENDDAFDAILDGGLQDTAEIPKKILEDIFHGRIAKLSDVTNKNGLRLLRCGWIFDTNFPATMKKIQNRGYITSTLDLLPDFDKKLELQHTLENYIEKKIMLVS